MDQPVWAGQLQVDTCAEKHVHITMHPQTGDCPSLGVAMDAQQAREFAEAVLAAATDVSPLH